MSNFPRSIGLPLPLVSTSVLAPVNPWDCVLFRLPAATHTTAPASTALSAAMVTGGLVSPKFIPPRLRLRTFALLSRAHSIPAMMSDILPFPFWSITFTFNKLAPGATPLYFPPEAAPEPAMIPDTRVPCPRRSSVVVSPSTKFFSPTTFPARSG